MKVWLCWCAAWILTGAGVAAVLRRSLQPRSIRSIRSLLLLLCALWVLFSCIAAEATRQYLTVYPYTLFVCVASALGLVVLGGSAGLATGWFMQRSNFGRGSDIAIGVLGALVTGWVEIVLSYNYAVYVVALSAIGAVFATFVLRLCASRTLDPAPAVLHCPPRRGNFVR